MDILDFGSARPGNDISRGSEASDTNDRILTTTPYSVDRSPPIHSITVSRRSSLERRGVRTTLECDGLLQAFGRDCGSAFTRQASEGCWTRQSRRGWRKPEAVVRETSVRIW